MISSDAWIFRKRKGFCWLHDLSKSNLVKTAFLSIHTAVVGSNLRNSSQSGQPIGTEGKKIVSHFFSEQMFSALICLSFLPCSILILNEKSGRVILAEYNSFSSHVVKTHRLANVAMQGDIQAIICGYYQYTENIHLARTKIIKLSVSAWGSRTLIVLYVGPSIRIKYHAYNNQLLDEVEHGIMNDQNRGLCYLPKPKAETDNTDTRFW